MTLKLNMKTPVGTFLVEGNTQLEVFEQISTIQEVFSETSCGLCNCEDLRYAVREVGKFKYPEIHCQNPECLARLSFGQNLAPKLGSLFPVRKLDKKSGKPDRKKGEFGKHRGWSKFKGDPEVES